MQKPTELVSHAQTGIALLDRRRHFAGFMIQTSCVEHVVVYEGVYSRRKLSLGIMRCDFEQQRDPLHH